MQPNPLKAGAEFRSSEEASVARYGDQQPADHDGEEDQRSALLTGCQPTRCCRNRGNSVPIRVTRAPLGAPKGRYASANRAVSTACARQRSCKGLVLIPASDIDFLEYSEVYGPGGAENLVGSPVCTPSSASRRRKAPWGAEPPTPQRSMRCRPRAQGVAAKRSVV
jgi:hypothetical protein